MMFTAGPWRYAEDRSGFKGRIVAIALVVTALPLPLWVLAPSAVASSLTGALAVLALIGWIFVYQGCSLGLRIGVEQVWFGGVRRAERRLRRGRTPWPPRQSAGFNFRTLFACPRAAVLSAEVITDPARLAQLKRDSTIGQPRGKAAIIKLGHFRAPFCRSYLQVTVDLSQARTPNFGATTTGGPYTRAATSSRFILSDVWTVPTRHPDQVRAVLAELAIAPPVSVAAQQ